MVIKIPTTVVRFGDRQSRADPLDPQWMTREIPLTTHLFRPGTLLSTAVTTTLPYINCTNLMRDEWIVPRSDSVSVQRVACLLWSTQGT